VKGKSVAAVVHPCPVIVRSVRPSVRPSVSSEEVLALWLLLLRLRFKLLLLLSFHRHHIRKKKAIAIAVAAIISVLPRAPLMPFPRHAMAVGTQYATANATNLAILLSSGRAVGAAAGGP